MKNKDLYEESKEAKSLNRRYKDSIFRLLFNDEKILRDLYNDIKGTDYGEDVPIKIRTLQDALFIDIKDDIAFTIGDKFVVLIEEQSTICENMPVRMLSYVGRLYEKMYDRREFYKRKRVMLPLPEFFVFYNGNEDLEKETMMRLSDSYEEEVPENSAELVVKVYNIKYNKGAEILQKNRYLYEYSTLLAYVEEYKSLGYDAEESVGRAISRCMDEGILYGFLQEHGSEVRGMLFDYVSKEEFAEIRAEERGEERYAEGRAERTIEIAKKLKEKGSDVGLITEVTGLPIEEIERL